MNEDVQFRDLAKQVGARAAERIDVAATAQKVVERLRAGEQAARSLPISPAWLRIAAALVVLVGGGLVLRQVTFGDRETTSHGAHFIADDLGDLNAQQLQDVLGHFDEIVGGTAATEGSADLHELDAQQLRAVLRSLEG